MGGRYYNSPVDERLNDELVELLCACAVMRDDAQRSLVLERLRADVEAPLVAGNTLRTTVANLVATCRDTGALAELLAAIRHFEGPSIAMMSIDIWCERAGLADQP